MRMNNPKHFYHILPFIQPADVHHTIPLTAQEVVRMHATPRTTSLLLWAPPTCRVTASHVRGSLPYHLLLLLLSRNRVVQPAPLLPHLSHRILHLFPFQIRGRVYRYGGKNLYRKMYYISHRKNTNVSSTVERCHLQHNFNISNHSSSHRRSHITNLFSPCPKVSGTTPKTYRSWSRKRIASRALGTLNVT